MVVASFMKRIIMVVVSSSVRRVMEHNNVRELEAILEIANKLKDYIRPSTLECSLNKLCNNMLKSRNGFQVQNLWSIEVQGLKP